jgi:hypothetical protein
LAIRRFQRQKLKRARKAVRGNNASQPVSIAKPSMMPSYDSLENRYRQFEFTSLHQTVHQFLCFSENRSKSARVRGRLGTRVIASALPYYVLILVCMWD